MHLFIILCFVLTSVCGGGIALVLSEATFDQLVELSGVGPTRA